jgi:hypothetical protein
MLCFLTLKHAVHIVTIAMLRASIHWEFSRILYDCVLKYYYIVPHNVNYARLVNIRTCHHHHRHNQCRVQALAAMMSVVYS